MPDETGPELFLRRLFSRLDESPVEYCVLRNYEDLPEHVDNDVDLWVAPESQEAFLAVVHSVGGDTRWQVHDYRTRLLGRGGGDLFVVSSGAGFEAIHLDVWTKLYWRGVSYVDESVLRSSLETSADDPFPTPSPGVEGAVLLVKDLLYGGSVPERYRERIGDCWSQDPETFRATLTAPFGSETTDELVRLVDGSAWSRIETRASDYRRTLLSRAPIGGVVPQLWTWLLYVGGFLRQFLRRDSGGLIVIAGPDGAGKTTTSETLRASPFATLFQDVDYHHGRLGYLPRLGSLLPGGPRNDESAPDESSEGKERYSAPRAALYPCYYLFDYLIGRLSVGWSRARGRLVLCDRYFYDYYYQPEFANCPCSLLNVLTRFVPTPDLLVVLHNDPQVIHERKPELTESEISRQLAVCRRLADRHGNAVVVETNDSPESVADAIAREYVMRER